MGSMPPDTEARKNAAKPGGGRARSRLRAGAALRRTLDGYGAASARFLDYLAVNDVRRRRTSLALAVALNIVVLSLMAAYGRIRIWIPSTPGESAISVVMVDLPTETVLPEPFEPEVVPEPEPEPQEEEPEVVPEPELEPEPEPAPVAEPEPEVAPEPQPQPEPEKAEPEPVIDLTSEPVLAPPAEQEPDIYVPEVDPGLEQEPGPLTVTEEQGPDLEPAAPEPPADEQQAPAEEAPPLLEEEQSPQPDSGLEVTDRTAEGEESPEVAGVPEETEEASVEPPANDDQFDEEPRFAPRSVLQLPQVDLPQGEASAAPGASGVVAIFCPEEFKDKDKAAECAGRTEIRSGWRPGSSGEDWSKARELLRQAQERGQTGDDPAAVFGPDIARRLEERQRQQDLEYGRRGVGVNDPAGAASGNLDRTLGRPDIGPRDFEPAWTLPADPNVSQEELRKLQKALEEAEKSKNPNN